MRNHRSEYVGPMRAVEISRVWRSHMWLFGLRKVGGIALHTVCDDILAADKNIRDAFVPRVLRDVNGNRIGTWKFGSNGSGGV